MFYLTYNFLKKLYLPRLLDWMKLCIVKFYASFVRLFPFMSSIIYVVYYQSPKFPGLPQQIYASNSILCCYFPPATYHSVVWLVPSSRNQIVLSIEHWISISTTTNVICARLRVIYLLISIFGRLHYAWQFGNGILQHSIVDSIRVDTQITIWHQTRRTRFVLNVAFTICEMPGPYRCNFTG